MKVIVSFIYANGWGDTLISIYDTLSFLKYVKEHFKDVETYFLINNKNNSSKESLESILDLEYFHNFVDNFYVLLSQNFIYIESGKINFDGLTYERIFSCHNDDVKNSIPGCFDVFVDTEHFNQFESFEIPFKSFTLRMESEFVEDFPIYDKKLIIDSKNFIENELNSDFETIYYRATNFLEFSKVDKFVQELVNSLDKNKTYFVCSNISYIKEKLLSSGLKIKLFRNLDNHKPNHFPNGFTFNYEDAYYPITEMLIMGKTKFIHYCGDQSHVSFFNFYPTCVMGVKLKNYVYDL